MFTRTTNAILILAVAGLGTPVTLACECAWVGVDGTLGGERPALSTEELEKYEAVLSGQVVGLWMQKERNPSADEYRFGDLVVTVEVSRAWKGVSGIYYEVRTPGQAPACGFDFELGGIYLLFVKSLVQLEREFFRPR